MSKELKKELIFILIIGRFYIKILYVFSPLNTKIGFEKKSFFIENRVQYRPVEIPKEKERMF